MMLRRWTTMLVLVACVLAPLCLLAAPSPYDAEPVSRAELMQEMAIKEKRVMDFLRQQKLAAVLITKVRNFSWITAGMADNHIVLSSEIGPASLLLTRDGGKFVIASMSEIPRLTSEDLLGLGYEARPYKWYDDQKRALIKDIMGGQPVGTDVPIDGMRTVELAPLRYSLTESEVKKYRWAGKATADAVEETCRMLKPGMSEREIEVLVADNLMRHGMHPTVLLIGVDERIYKFRHATPSTARLKKYAMVNVCAKRWGLIVAVTRFVHFGALPPDLEKKVRAAAYVNAHMQDMTRPGLRADILFEKMVAAYSEVGFGSEWEQHHQGGAIGYEERDWVLRTGLDENVQEPQAFAWNPSIEGVKMEDTIITFRKGVENLTQTSTWPAIKTVVNGQNYFSANILVIGGPNSNATLPAGRPTASSAAPTATPTTYIPPPTPRPRVTAPAPSPTATPTTYIPPPTPPRVTPSAPSPTATPTTYVPPPTPRPRVTPTAPVPSRSATATPAPSSSATAIPATPRPSASPTSSPGPTTAPGALPTATSSPRPRPTLSVAPPATRTPSPKPTRSGGSGFE